METAAWMRSEGYRSLRLVTAGYHMRRSLFEFARAMPEMRIIDQEIWDAVKARQQSLAYGTSEPGENALNDRRRPKHLFAGLVKCGCCGGGYTMISKDLLGCATARNKGTCDNRLNIRRDALETSVLSGLRTHLMEPELFKVFFVTSSTARSTVCVWTGAPLSKLSAPS